MKTLITFKIQEEEKEPVVKYFEGKADPIFLVDHPNEKKELIASAEILFSRNPEAEGLYDDELSFDNLKFIQLLSAGYDHVQINKFPESVIIAANQGAYAAPMAEHAVAMIMALAKRLPLYHKELAKGNYSQRHTPTKAINNAVLGIIGFGAIGQATMDLLRPFGIRVWGLNTSGKTDRNVDFIGTFQDLDYVLKNVDILLISCPLNKETRGLLSKEKLILMKEDAILVNVARGAIVVEKDLYQHLKDHPRFYAGLDVWWGEPFKNDEFELHYPFFDLPNLLGSPHNSTLVPDGILNAIEYAARNIERYFEHKPVKGIIK